MTTINYTFNLIFGQNIDADPALEFEFDGNYIADDIHSIGGGDQTKFNDAIKEWERVAQIDFTEVASPGSGFSGWAFNYANLPGDDDGAVGEISRVLFIDDAAVGNVNKGDYILDVPDVR